MGGPGEHKQVEQAAYISVSDNSKVVGIELNRIHSFIMMKGALPFKRERLLHFLGSFLSM